MQTPLLVHQEANPADRRRKRKLVAAGLVIFVASLLVTLGVCLGMRAIETQQARSAFVAMSDDFCSKVFKTVRDGYRDSRRLAAYMRFEIEALGSLPSREWFDSAVSRLRADPNKAFLRMSFSPRIAVGERAKFEAAMSREAGRNVSIYVPTTGKQAPPANEAYVSILYSNTGTEPVRGPAYEYVGWDWASMSPSVRDLVNRSAATGRVMASEPLPYGTQHSQALYSMAPVFVRPQSFELWQPGASVNPETPILYCSNGPCPPSYSRNPPDPRADFVVSAALIHAPLYGIDLNNTRASKLQGLGELVPLCEPALSFVPGTDYENFTAATPDPDVKGPCQPRRQQAQNIQAAPFLLQKGKGLLVGMLSFTTFSGQLAGRALRQLDDNQQVIIAGEDIEDSQAWPVQVRTWTRDSWITALPSASWQTQAVVNKGKSPPAMLPPTKETLAQQKTRISVKGAEALDFRPSAFSPDVWVAVEAPSFPTPDARFGFAIGGDLLRSGATGPCTNMSTGNSSSSFVTLCPPNLSLQEYQRRTANSKFRASFIGLVGGRLYRLEVSSLEPYRVDHANSRNALIGGLVLSGFLVCIVLTALLTRQQQVKQRQQFAAEGAHNLVVDYCVSEVKHCNDGLVYQLGKLQRSLPALAEVDRQLRTEMACLTAMPVAGIGQEAEEEEDDALRRQQEVRRSRAQLLALQGVLAPALEKLDNDVSVMEVSCEQLHEVSNDFSDYSKLRAGQFEIRHKLVNVRAVISRAVEAATSGLGARVRVSISPSLPSHALVDPLRIQQVLVNGISNAAKYSRDVSMRVKGLDDGDTVERLDSLGTSAWYKGRIPDLPVLRSQVGQRLEAAPGSHTTDVAADTAPRRRFWHVQSNSGPAKPSLPSSLVNQRRDLQDAASDLFVQHLVLCISHTVSFGLSESLSSEGGSPEAQRAAPQASAGASSAWGAALSRLGLQKRKPAPQPAAAAPASTKAAPVAFGGEVEMSTFPAGSDSTRSDEQQQLSTPSSAVPGSAATSRISTLGRVSTGRSSTADVALHGTSIGLALSSSLVERMGGYIALSEVSDTRNATTTFYSVVLPCWVVDRRSTHSTADTATASNVSGGAAVSNVASAGGTLAIRSPVSPQEAAPSHFSPTTNHELSLIGTRSSGRLNLWRADSGSPLASAQPMDAPSPTGFGLVGESAGADQMQATPTLSNDTESSTGSAAPLLGSRLPAPGVRRNTAAPALAHVLLADDDLVNRRLGKRMLERLHCTCDTIDDVSTAAACFERTGQLPHSLTSDRIPPDTSTLDLSLSDHPRPYDFALFDIHCGKTPGWVVCKELKARGLCGVPIFAMTGNTDPSDLQTYYDAGMEAVVLGKPFTVETLERVLESALESRPPRS